MEQQQTRFDISFKSWTTKELTIDKDKAASANALFYNVKQDWIFKKELKVITAGLTVTVVTDQNNHEGSMVAKLVLSVELGATGFTNQVPKEVFGQIGMILVHTARGILLHAGTGTILARFAVPMYTVEQLAGL
jgi:hypothetical protein